MDPSELLIPINDPVLLPTGKMADVWWRYFVEVAAGLGSIDLTSQVTGILPAANGGTGINNSTRTITIGGFSLTLTQTGATSLTTPTSGTLISTTGLQQQTATTGVVAGGATAVITLTWPIAFADTNYSAVASVLDTTAAVASLSVVHIESKTAGAITVRVTNAAVGAITGTVLGIALHAA